MSINPISEMLQNSLQEMNKAQENLEKCRGDFHAAEILYSTTKATYEAFRKAHAAASDSVDDDNSNSSAGASEDTKKIFSLVHMIKGGSEFGYKDIDVSGMLAGVKVNKTNMRSNTSDYVRNGYLLRPKNGSFIITETGKEFFGINDADNPLGDASRLVNSEEGLVVIPTPRRKAE